MSEPLVVVAFMVGMATMCFAAAYACTWLICRVSEWAERRARERREDEAVERALEDAFD